MGFDFIAVVPLLPSPGGLFVFGCKVSFFGQFKLFFCNGFSAVSCDFGVSVRRGELMSYSTIFSPPPRNPWI